MSKENQKENKNQQDSNLPEAGLIIECPSGDAFIGEQERDGKPSYSAICHRNKDTGQWMLNDREGKGLRIMLGNHKPTGYVAKIKVTYHCKNLTCIFGEVVQG